MYPLSYLEHTRAVRPSTVLEVYLIFTLLLDIPQARTLFLRSDVNSIAALYVVAMAAMVLVWWLESRKKTADLKELYKGYPPEAISGVWNRTLFLWLNSLFLKGFKRLLSLDDLWENPPNLSSEKLRDEMQITWDRRRRLVLCYTPERWPLMISRYAGATLRINLGLRKMPSLVVTLRCSSSTVSDWFQLRPAFPYHPHD